MKTTTLIALVLATSITLQTTATFADSVNMGNDAVIAKTSANMNSLIKKEVKSLKKNIDSGAMSVNAALTSFADAVYGAGLTVADLDAYVKANASAKQYKQFQAVVEKANASIGDQAMNEELMGQLAGEALNAVNPEGLAWSGCTGLGIGIVAVVGAVVIGIVALAKTAGEERIHARYDRKRSNAQNLLLSNMEYLKNRPAEIDRSITSYNGKIDDAQVQIVYLTGKLVSENDATIRQQYGDQIKQYTANINSYQTEIEKLTDERNLYANASWVDGQRRMYQQEYDTSVAQLNSEEVRKIALIPANKQLAKTLGITAGVVGAIGAYFTIDGALDCRNQ